MDLDASSLSMTFTCKNNLIFKKMKHKKLFAVVMSVVMMSGIFFSCSSDENEVFEPSNTSVSDSLVKSEHYQLLQNLQTLNDDLSASLCVTKGKRWKSFWQAVGDFFLADTNGFLSGAVKGGMKGLASGSWTDTAIGILTQGTASAVEASVETVKGYFNRTTKGVVDSSSDALFSSDLKDIEKGYAYMKAHPDSVDKILDREGINLISIELPEEYGDDAKYVASMHNAILYILDHGIDDENFVPELSKEEEQIFHSPEFIEWFNNTMKLYETDEWKDANMEMVEFQIHKLFSDAVLECVEDINDLIKVVNEYIRVIEADESISTDQKRIIYTSLTVATYSFQHWDSVFGFEKMSEQAN